jgi:hypothetical protein
VELVQINTIVEWITAMEAVEFSGAAVLMFVADDVGFNRISKINKKIIIK